MDLAAQITTEHNKGQRFIEIVGGGRVYYGSADRAETLEGANVAVVWGDEARYWKRVAWQIVQARCRDPKARRLAILLTTTLSALSGWLSG